MGGEAMGGKAMVKHDREVALAGIWKGSEEEAKGRKEKENTTGQEGQVVGLASCHVINPCLGTGVYNMGNQSCFRARR